MNVFVYIDFSSCKTKKFGDDAIHSFLCFPPFFSVETFPLKLFNHCSWDIPYLSSGAVFILIPLYFAWLTCPHCCLNGALVLNFRPF